MKIGLTLLIALMFILIPISAQEISECTVINSPGNYYLANDLYGSPDAPCIIINASNVVLDCRHHTIYGPGGSFGIITINETSAPGYRTGIQIHNCQLENFYRAISVHGIVTIRNVTIDAKNVEGSMGIVLTYGDIAGILNVSVINADVGIGIYSSGSVVIEKTRLIADKTCMRLSGIEFIDIHDSTFNCFSRSLDVYGGQVTGRIYNNAFYRGDVVVTGTHSLVFWVTPSAPGRCWTNYLKGCRIGGNYWYDYSRNCRNDNRDSFCDFAYQIPGTNFVDNYPLAEPQPYLCAYLEVNKIYMAPTDTKTINWYLTWNSRIVQPNFQVVSAPSGFSVSFDTSQCNFGAENGICTVKVNINTNNVNIGSYSLQIRATCADCNYDETITVDVASQPCSGTVTLTLNPSVVNPGGQFTAIISGLSNCGGVAYIRDYRGCVDGETLATCQVTGSGCSATLNAPTNPGLYRYYACFDMNLDGQFLSGEYDYKDLEVTTGPTPGCGVITSSGTYTISNDVYAPAGNTFCYYISANNVTFDCQGYTIFGNNVQYGFFIADSSNVEVKNCRIVDFQASILTDESRDIRIYNNFLNASFSGIITKESSGISISNNEIISRIAGIWFSSNTSSVIVEKNGIAGFASFILETDAYNIDILRNSINVRLSKLYIGTPTRYLFFVENGSLVSARFYDNVVKGRPDVILYSMDNVPPNIKLNIPPTDGISITYNMKVGGNFWWDFSEECEDNNFDNFCDTPYEAEYGIKDEYPLATLRTFYACLSDIMNMGYYVHSSDIDKPGEYRLGADINASVSGLECFRIFVEPSPPYSWFTGAGHVNNVVFDCQGHTIRYNGSLYVFDVLSATNFTLKNCKIEVSPSAKGAILYATYTNTVEAPAITLINNEIISHPPALIATAPAECELPEAPKVIPDITNDKIKVFLYNNKIVSGSTALKIYCALGEITRNNITATKCMQIGNPDYFRGFGLVKAVKVYDNMMFCDIYQPIEIDSAYPQTLYAWNIKPTPGPNILGGGTIGGNFWYNYSLKCNDTNFDGFCDEPFVINAENKDEYPLSSYVLTVALPPIPAYPMLTLASVFFMLSLGFSAALEYVVSRSGSSPFGLVFGISFIVMMILGSLLNILPGWILIAVTIASAFLFGYIILRMVMGG